MGYDYPEEIDGVNATQPIFQRFMTKIHENLVVKSFAEAKTVKNSLTTEQETTSASQEATTAAASETQPTEENSGVRDPDTDAVGHTTASYDTQHNGNVESTTGRNAENTTRGSTTTRTTAAQSATQRTTSSVVYPGVDTDVDISGYGDRDVR
jgi:membrane carboxypeptidase/penicillin-binding protein